MSCIADMNAFTVSCIRVSLEQVIKLKEERKVEVDVIDSGRMNSPAVEALFKVHGGGAHLSDISIRPADAKHRACCVILPPTTPNTSLRPALVGAVECHKLSSDSSSDPDSESDWTDTDSEADSDSDDELDCDEADPWAKALRLNSVSTATPENSPVPSNNTSPTFPNAASAELLAERLKSCAKRHIICWTCGVTLTHMPGCRRKHVPSKVRIPLQPAREMAFPKPLPAIRECEVELPEPAPTQSSQPSITIFEQSASMKMLAHIAAKDARARKNASSPTAARMIATPVKCAVKFQGYLHRGLTRANTSLSDYKSQPSLFDIFPHITLVDAVAAQC